MDTFLKFLRYISIGFNLLLASTSVLHAQEEGDKPQFPLDNFYAERKKWPRNVLKDFHLGISTGFGTTFFSHKLNGFGVFQRPGFTPRIFVAGPAVGSRYSNWVNQIAGDTLSVQPGNFLISSDTATLGFKGRGLNIPLKATLHYEYDRYRIGGGYSYEFMHLGEFRPITHKDRIGNFSAASPNGFMRKYFGLLGVSFYRINDYLFTAEANVGGYKPGRNFNMALIQRGVYVNLGLTIERDFSEYLKAFVRPSYEIKNYTIANPEAGRSIVHNMNGFYLNFGFTYSLPELPKCYHKDCRAQINHAHGDREYRSRVHPVYKKQNPMYGENHPKLIKYKGKNRKKLNPY